MAMSASEGRLVPGLFVLLALASLPLSAAAAAAAAAKECAAREEEPCPRLPAHAVPLMADLTITPDFEENTFEGRVSFLVRTDLYGISENINTFVLHAEELDISSCLILETSNEEMRRDATVRDTSDENLSCVERLTYNSATHLLTLKHHDNLKHYVVYNLVLNFKGRIRDDMTGFYETHYTDDSGQRRKVLATQFQPTHARKVFPCFDEPGFKANYTVSIVIPSTHPEYHALGNMPVDDDFIQEDNTRKFVFYPTIPISSYLLAWVVSDFDSTSDELNNARDVAFHTWSRSNALSSTKYSLEVSRPLLETLELYTGIPYVYKNHEPQLLNKIDQVAIPDFSAGAMENWGLITYRETALLFNDGPESARRRIAIIIAHELAHMWFGNLVTTALWDTTWLNEGFAEYFEYHALDAVNPEWRMLEQLVVEDMHSALATDALTSSPPLTRAVCSAADASAAFHSLTYTKGASILRMFSYIVGEDNFREALRKYLDTHAFEAVVPEDLFKELKVYSGAAGLSYVEMDELLRMWTERSGYPVIIVFRDYKERTATIRQLRYLTVPQNPDFTPYYVPLTWTHRGNGFEIHRPQLYLTNDVPVNTIGGMPDNDTWVIFNVQQTGFYRVNYDLENWDLIINYLNSEANPLDGIHVLNRAQLLDDAFSFGRCGRLEYSTIFRLLNYLPREADYIPWTAFFYGLSYVDRMLVNQEQYPLFKKYILNLILKLYERFEFEKQQSHLENLLLNRVSSWACALDHPHCIESAVTALQEFLDNEKPVEANLRSVVYCHGIRNSDDKYWDLLWHEYLDSLDDTERSMILTGLGCTRSEERLRQFLLYSIDSQYIRKQDASSVFTAVYSNSHGVEVALDFLADHFESILSYYGAMGAIQNILTGIAARVTTPEQVEKLTNFVDTHRDQLGSTADAALETVEPNRLWIYLNADEIFQTIEENSLYRLPTTITPEQYNLRLIPDLDADTFRGEVSITILVEEATDNILLHAQDLTILQSDVEVFKGSASRGKVLANNKIQDSKSHHLKFISPREDSILQNIVTLSNFQLIRLVLREPLVPGEKYTIEIKYSGPLRTDMVGFYKTSYSDDRGTPRYLVATKFAPTHARKAFPCFDEPGFKARVKLTLVIPAALPGYDCIGNSEKEDGGTRVLDDGSTEVVFKNSLKMSTYIVAWVISDLQPVVDPIERPVKFVTWTRRNIVAWAEYSLNVSANMLQKLEDYTGYPYADELGDEFPLHKVDQVGTPDFVSGAMENWGLITYRETALLYNDGNAAALKRVASVIAHELAHMWFGNLVTCAWWEATWLNEGFATYFQHLVTQHAEPSWQIMDEFVVDYMQAALAADALSSAKPLTHRVTTPADAVASFGSLTYSKGGTFLRMLSYVMGEQNMENALKAYVASNAYKATTPNDLFVELVKYASISGFESEEEMLQFLRSWTEEPGYPLLHVTRHYDGSGRVTITQERFLSPQGDYAPQLYYVPLTWVEEGGIFDRPIVRGYLTNRERSKDLQEVKEDGWLVFNTQQMGYFRVMYDDENWRRITQAIPQRLDNIHWLNRAQLLDDAFALAATGRLSYSQLLMLTDYLVIENEYTPWAAALAGFSQLDRMLASHAGYELFQAYVLGLLSNAYAGHGFRVRTWHWERLLATTVTARACAAGHQGCRDEAVRQLQEDLNGGARIHGDMRSAVYCHGLRHAGAAAGEVWQALWERFRQSPDEADRALMLTGLGCSADADALRRLLEYTISGEGVRKQEATSAFAAVYATQLGADVTLQFLLDKYEDTRAYLLESVTTVVSGLASRLTTPNQIVLLNELIHGRWGDGLSSIGLSAEQAANRNLQWISNHANILISLIDVRVTTTTTTTTTTVPTTTTPTTTSTSTTTPPPTTPEEATTVPTTPEEVTTEEDPSTTTDSGSTITVTFCLLLLATVALIL